MGIFNTFHSINDIIIPFFYTRNTGNNDSW